MAFTLPNFPINDASQSLSAALQRVMGARLAAAQSQQQENRNPYEAQDIQSAIKQRLSSANYSDAEATNANYKREHGLLQPELVQLLNAAYSGNLPIGNQTGVAQQPEQQLAPTQQPQSTDNMSRHDIVNRANEDQAKYDEENNNPQRMSLLAENIAKAQQKLEQNKPKTVQEITQQQSGTGLIPGTNIPSTGRGGLADQIVLKALGLSYLNNGTGANKYSPAQQKNIAAFQQQVINDTPELQNNPQLADKVVSAYLNGAESVDGFELKPLSGKASTLLTAIQKANSTAAVQNQAVQADVVAQDINDIDITPVAKFAGLPGKLDILKYKSMMATGNADKVPNEAREYLAFQKVASTFAMDALRKGFGTSVVPDYVYKTLGKATDPTASFFNDPKQVMKEWKQMTDWVNSNADRYSAKAKYGVGAKVGKRDSNESSSASSENSDMIKVRDSSGSIHEIHRSQLDTANKRAKDAGLTLEEVK